MNYAVYQPIRKLDSAVTGKIKEKLNLEPFDVMTAVCQLPSATMLADVNTIGPSRLEYISARR